MPNRSKKAATANIYYLFYKFYSKKQPISYHQYQFYQTYHMKKFLLIISLTMVCATAWAQKAMFKGTVSDQKEALIGATVTV